MKRLNPQIHVFEKMQQGYGVCTAANGDQKPGRCRDTVFFQKIFDNLPHGIVYLNV